ncbi:MAG: flagellar biosynthesis protein FliQ [Candidatus Manganitrophus sp.]|nr:flagellar biosynthesis protein FliQ [Candidatus Manganitrophus sp.]
MTMEFVVEMGQRTIETALLLAAPALLFSLAAGLLVSFFQAVTQINEATLTFLPKILAVALALLIFFPWMLSLLIEFTSRLLINLPNYVH